MVAAARIRAIFFRSTMIAEIVVHRNQNAPTVRMRRRHRNVHARKVVAEIDHLIIRLSAFVAWLGRLPAHLRDAGRLVKRVLPKIARALQLGARHHREPRRRWNRLHFGTMLVVRRDAGGERRFERHRGIARAQAGRKRVVEHADERRAIALDQRLCNFICMVAKRVKRPRGRRAEGARRERQQIAHVAERGLEQRERVVIDRVAIRGRLNIVDVVDDLVIPLARQRLDVRISLINRAEDLCADRAAQIREFRRERVGSIDDAAIDRLCESSEIRLCPFEPPRALFSHLRPTSRRFRHHAARTTASPESAVFRAVPLRQGRSSANR